MIISKDNHPHSQVYYLGAQVLKALKNGGGTMDFIDMYKEIKEQEKISIKLFILVLDWLFILDLIRSEQGVIHKCS
ncbi:hypothetical protein CKO50_23515 [Pseudoalteromonas sp. HM-SA03]|uniref:ABC-three component system middle component 6 n=1 Tax=Pseudoalteromonas sp. HM-SA03 TaxID=2029678 RepID=UPI000BAE0DC3|nr:ABC-three component system middle component 6 [Pseudoalteromonas sp. HM-SA03]PAX98972.1 hypothetical protein CKO50_23515 [Pseudoalteromonas sp. HM-SA03]